MIKMGSIELILKNINCKYMVKLFFVNILNRGLFLFFELKFLLLLMKCFVLVFRFVIFKVGEVFFLVFLKYLNIELMCLKGIERNRFLWVYIVKLFVKLYYGEM